MRTAYLEEHVGIQGDVGFLRQDRVEGAGAQEDEHVSGEQRGRSGRAGRARAAILEQRLQPQQGQHALGRIHDQAATPRAPHRYMLGISIGREEPRAPVSEPVLPFRD